LKPSGFAGFSKDAAGLSSRSMCMSFSAFV
jgi:hypothetical protein